MFTDLHLDLDDDLFLFQKFESLAKIWEFYEIHSTIPRKLLSYGYWNNGEGLVIPNPSKWSRRGNLEVVSVFCTLVTSFTCMRQKIYVCVK